MTDTTVSSYPPGVEHYQAETPTLEYASKWVSSYPLWVGPLPEGTYNLYPLKPVWVDRTINLRVDGEWETFSYGSWIHPEIEGLTRDQGSRCVVRKEKKLYVVQWKDHYCAEPPQRMEAEDWDWLLGDDDD
jgi:hypothetical protein